MKKFHNLLQQEILAREFALKVEAERLHPDTCRYLDAMSCEPPTRPRKAGHPNQAKPLVLRSITCRTVVRRMDFAML